MEASWPPKGWTGPRYRLQGAGFAEPTLRRLRLQVFHADAGGAVIADGVATADLAGTMPTARLSLSVPAGPNRWAVLSGADPEGHVLASLMSAASLDDGNSFELSFDGVSHAAGRALATWRPSGLPAAPNHLPRVRAFIQRATGHDLARNEHTGPNPYAFPAEQLGNALVGGTGFLDLAPTGAYLAEGWGKTLVQVTSQGHPVEAGSHSVTLFDPISAGELVSPFGTPKDLSPGEWSYRVDGPSGSSWGSFTVQEGQQQVLRIPVDRGNPMPPGGPWQPLTQGPVLSSAFVPTGLNSPSARGLTVGMADGGASEAFALRLSGEGTGLLGSLGVPVAVPALSSRQIRQVWAAATATDLGVVGRRSSGVLARFRSPAVDVDAGTLTFLGDLPATTPVVDAPGQVAIAGDNNNLFTAYRSGDDVVLAPLPGNAVRARFSFPVRSLALAVVRNRPWVAAEIEATGGQALLQLGQVNTATGQVDPSWIVGEGADDLRAPALVDLGAGRMALAYERHLPGGVQVACRYFDDAAASAPELFAPLSPAFDQLGPSLHSAGEGTPPWLVFSERPSVIGGQVRLRAGQVGAPSFVLAEAALGDLPQGQGLLPTDDGALGVAAMWGLLHQLPNQAPVARALARPLAPLTALPALLP